MSDNPKVNNLTENVRRALVKRQLQHVRDQKAARLTLLPQDEPVELSRWQRVRAVFADYWRIAKMRLKGEL